MLCPAQPSQAPCLAAQHLEGRGGGPSFHIIQYPFLHIVGLHLMESGLLDELEAMLECAIHVVNVNSREEGLVRISMLYIYIGNEGTHPDSVTVTI